MRERERSLLAFIDRSDCAGLFASMTSALGIAVFLSVCVRWSNALEVVIRAADRQRRCRISIVIDQSVRFSVVTTPQTQRGNYTGKRNYKSDTAPPRRHCWATVYKTVRPMLSDRCLSVTLVYCGQTVAHLSYCSALV